mgnify:FL=1
MNMMNEVEVGLLSAHEVVLCNEMDLGLLYRF